MVTIALLALHESAGAPLYGLYDLLIGVRRDWSTLVLGRSRENPFDVRLVAQKAGVLELTSGLLVKAHADLSEVPDIVCIPELAVAPAESLKDRFLPEIDYLRRCRAGGAIVTTACSGALLLAEAGMLQGHDATTHWLYNRKLASYPEVNVIEKQSLVVSDEGHLVMAGGGTSWQDLALYLIARYVDVEEAMRTARMHMINWHADGQQPFAALSQNQKAEDALVSKCQIWIAENYQTPSPVASLLEMSGVAERSFHRRFKNATGLSPLEYVQAVRIEEAKQMLERESTPVDQIAFEVGYDDASFFGRLFRRKVGLTPAQYRRRFAGLRGRLKVIT